MCKAKYLKFSALLLTTFLFVGSFFGNAANLLAQDSPLLGAAESYSVLAGSIVTNTGPTTVSGDLGISPGIGAPPHYTGFPPGAVGPPGEIHDADAHAAAAQADNTAAFGFLDQGCDVTYPGVQDLTLVSPLGPGTYCADAFLLTGNLTLSGSGVWIFKSAATLTTSANSTVTGGDPCNVWWRLVSSGTLGTGTEFIGNILALTDISLQTGATLNGRALVQTGQVTLDSNIITGPICAVSQPTPTGTATTTATATTTPPATETPPPPPTDTPAPPPPPTDTPAPPPTNTPAPPPPGLPDTGGAPIRSEGSPWSLPIAGLFIAIVLFLGVQAYRNAYQPKQ
jgi:cell division septation protein DedD